MTTPRQAFVMGHRVGTGASPEQAAAYEGITLQDFIDIRIGFHEDYDEGLVAGREKA